MLVKVEFQKGAIGTGHRHYHSQTTYVSSGVFDFYIEDRTQTIKAGDGVYVPPEAFHGVTCIEPGILIDVFSPAREDFLKTR
jgi:quercetin dioxygenase-like cupin family protein